MKSESLRPIIDSIYTEFEPLSNLEDNLFNNNSTNHLKKIVERNSKNLDETQIKRIHEELFSWGPIEQLRHKENIFDIIIRGPDHIYYEDSSGFHQLDDRFLSPLSFQNFVEELFKSADVQVSQKEPYGNGRIESFRIHAITPPLTQEINITLRKHQAQIIPLALLLEKEFLSQPQLDLIGKIIETRANFMIIGPTGSGKTTFLNSLIHNLIYEQRVVIIEDTRELVVPNNFSTQLLSRNVCPTTLKPVLLEDLVKQSLRMRPDRIIVGEVRGPEAKDLLLALATGHSGSIGTLHAQSGSQALYRLEMLIQMGAPQWSLESIRRLIQMSLDYLIVLKEDRYNKGLEGIYKISSLEKFGLLINKED